MVRVCVRASFLSADAMIVCVCVCVCVCAGCWWFSTHTYAKELRGGEYGLPFLVHSDTAIAPDVVERETSEWRNLGWAIIDGVTWDDGSLSEKGS